MKIITVIFVLFSLVTSAQNPYTALVYDSLVIYDYGFEGEGESNIKQTGKYYSFITKPAKSVKLTKAEAKEFSFRINADSSYGQGVASCFDPHFAAFYYKGGKVIANVEICIACNRLDPTLDITAPYKNPQKTDDGDVYYIDNGLSRSYRLYLKALLNKYGFSHAPTGESIFDTDY